MNKKFKKGKKIFPKYYYFVHTHNHTHTHMHIDNSASGRCATAALFTPYILQGYNPCTQSTLHHGATTTIFSSYLYLKIIHRRDRSLNVNTPSNSFFMYIHILFFIHISFVSFLYTKKIYTWTQQTRIH